MKPLLILSIVLLITSCANTQGKKFTASTPATAKEVRSFLGIKATDSVDFIRWWVTLTETGYELKANYGIGKPNTSGFYDGGKHVSLSGQAKLENKVYTLENNASKIHLAIINEDIMHFKSNNGQLLIGTGGWSYSLNAANHDATSTSLLNSDPLFNDSLHLYGRTACNISSLADITPGNCHKLKWSMVLYPGSSKDSGPCKIKGTAWDHQEIQMNWRLSKNNGLYVINDGKNDRLFLKRIDENIFMITDEEGKLLVGNEDFSYTLNRR